jgi:hypothetical protein
MPSVPLGRALVVLLAGFLGFGALGGFPRVAGALLGGGLFLGGGLRGRDMRALFGNG